MTPDDRLDQLEPLIADGLQKIDRLIEGQGKLVELATKTDKKADTIAKGVGNLTVKVSQITDNQSQLRQDVNQIADEQTQFRQEVKQGFIEMNQRFDSLITLIQERLK